MNDSERESTTSADEARLRAIENNQETTVSNAKVVDNDHLVEDANTERKLTVTHEALAREKTKRRSKPLLVFLLALLLILLGGLAGALVYKSFFEQSAPSTTSTCRSPEKSFSSGHCLTSASGRPSGRIFSASAASR